MKKYNIQNYVRYKNDVKRAVARLKNKMWDVVICFSFLLSIGISKIIMGFDPQFQFMKIAMGLT